MALSLEKLIERTDNFAISNAVNNGEPIADIGRRQTNCDKHGVFMSTGRRLIRREVWSVCQKCNEEREASEIEERRIAMVRRAAYERKALMDRATVPTRFAGRTLAAFNAETPEQIRALAISTSFVRDWDLNLKKGAWLVFSGLPGTGKSHLAIAILQAILPNHVGRYMTCMELIQTLRATWRKESTQSECDLLDEITELPLLVLDEIGVQYGTDSEQNHLFDVLDRRYREMRPTILLTNQNKDGFKAFVGDRVYDRMTEVARWVPFTWPSYRPQARKEIVDA